MKKALIGIMLLLLGVGGYFAWVKFSPNSFTDAYYLVPENAVMVIETEDPIGNWQTFSTSNMWLGLKKFPAFAEISKNADFMDDIIKSNQQVFSSLGKRHLLISAHMTKAKDYEFVYYADMSEASKSSAIKTSLISLIKRFDFKHTVRDINGIEVQEFLDPKTREVLSICFLKNYLVCSYNKTLIENVIFSSTDITKQLGYQARFAEVNRLTSNKGICRILLNHKYFHQYLGVYMDDVQDVKELLGSLFYTGLDCTLKDDLILADGYTIVNDSLSSYIQALSISGKSETNAEKIISERASFYLNLGFVDFNTFYENLDKVLQKDPKAYLEKEKSIKKLKSYLGIDLKKDLFSWMGSEIAIAQYQTDALIGYKVRSVIAIKTTNTADAIESLERIEKQIRKKTPLRFKNIEYKGYTIKYLEIKGLFRAILGKLFGKIEKPYYTIIDNYVVMSDDPKTLLLTIEDFIAQKTLKNNIEFRSFRDNFPNQTSFLTYLSPNRHFANFKGLLNKESWESSNKNHEHIRSFSDVGITLSGENDKMRTMFGANYSKWEPKPKLELKTAEDSLNFMESDTLSFMDLFIIYHFQNNMNNIFYENGNIKSSMEMDGIIADGSFIEYFENGIIKTKGRYKKGVKEGTWKTYKSNGEQESKIPYKNGEPLKETSIWKKLFG